METLCKRRSHDFVRGQTALDLCVSGGGDFNQTLLFILIITIYFNQMVRNVQMFTNQIFVSHVKFEVMGFGQSLVGVL